MPEDIRDLIEKINQEGIRAAEEKAQNIETLAKQRADEIIAQAKIEADNIIAAAKDRILREEKTEKALLAQAGRDLLLSLRKEINTMLDRIVVSDVRKALTPEALFHLISAVVRSHEALERHDITVLLTREDLEILEKTYFNKLKEETKNNIILKSTGEISGGFTISFDRGKSSYDFSDKALAEYIGTYLKPKLNQILKDAIRE